MSIKQYNCILFDWDGCIVNTVDVWVDSIRRTFKQYNLYPTDAEIITHVLGYDEGPLKLGIKNLSEFWQRSIKDYHSNQYRVSLNQYVANTLKMLKERKKKIGVVTRTQKKSIDDILPSLYIQRYIDTIITREDVENYKPHPEAIFKAVDILRVNPENTIIIGDSQHDILAGKTAGIATILYYPSHNERYYSAKYVRQLEPDHIIKQFSDLLDIVI